MADQVKLMLCEELRKAIAEFMKLSNCADANNHINKCRWYEVQQDIDNIVKQLAEMERNTKKETL